jgi:molybdopterin-guanine dinucleotide biosynthesis protein A
MEIDRVGAILGGGAGARMGGRKALVMLAGVPLVEHVARVLRPAAANLAMVGDAQAANAISATVLADPPGLPAGPLSGICAALEWARGLKAEGVIIAPCDTPLITPSIIAMLSAAVAAGAPIACAQTEDGVQPLVSVWRSDLAAWLRSELGPGHPAVHAVLKRAGAAHIPFADRSAFLNVNTPDDLKRAEAVLAARA